MSTYDPDSEISLFNKHSDTTKFEVSAEFVKVVRKAQEVSNLSSGAFDITVAPLVNLWGFGKKSQRMDPPTDSEILRLY
jgi:thiamine biosynthesis lipoprotein